MELKTLNNWPLITTQPETQWTFWCFLLTTAQHNSFGFLFDRIYGQNLLSSFLLVWKLSLKFWWVCETQPDSFKCGSLSLKVALLPQRGWRTKEAPPPRADAPPVQRWDLMAPVRTSVSGCCCVVSLRTRWTKGGWRKWCGAGPWTQAWLEGDRYMIAGREKWYSVLRYVIFTRLKGTKWS